MSCLLETSSSNKAKDFYLQVLNGETRAMVSTPPPGGLHLKVLLVFISFLIHLFSFIEVFRGTCGYPLCEEDKNCSHLHLHVWRMYCGIACKPNQTACCYVVTWCVVLGSFPMFWFSQKQDMLKPTYLSSVWTTRRPWGGDSYKDY